MIDDNVFIEMIDIVDEIIDDTDINSISESNIADNLKRIFNEFVSQKSYDIKDVKNSIRKEDSMSIYLNSKMNKGRKL